MNSALITQLLWVAGKAFAIALILTPVIRDISRSFRVVDKPGDRKIHVYPIPRTGGIALAIAYAFSLYSFGHSSNALSNQTVNTIWSLVPGAAVVFLTGLLDDFFNFRPIYKIAGQVAAGGLVFWNGVKIDSIARQPVAPWLSLILTLVWILVTTNALNLIDGLDGLCAGVSFVATLTLFAAALLQANTPLAYATLPLAGALLGFLCYNFNPATTFLGDSGALLLGFLLGCYGMIWTQKATTLLSLSVPLLALSIPLLDVSLSVVRRLLSGKPIFSADRRHIHHRLLDRGLTPRRAVFILYLAAAGAAAFALLMSLPVIGRYRAALIVGFCGAAWVGIRQLRYGEFHAAGSLFRGVLPKEGERLQELTSGLAQATDEDKYWDALVNAARELGWTRIRWTSSQGERYQVLDEATPNWTFRFITPDGGSIEVEGSLASPGNDDLKAFAETVSRISDKKNWRQKHAAMQ